MQDFFLGLFPFCKFLLLGAGYFAYCLPDDAKFF